MDQMTQNPELMQNMMSSPYVQNMMSQMAQNPELMGSVSISTCFRLFNKKCRSPKKFWVPILFLYLFEV
jgi:hypothetical protein